LGVKAAEWDELVAPSAAAFTLPVEAVTVQEVTVPRVS
jgi:hypothetical protein